MAKSSARTPASADEAVRLLEAYLGEDNVRFLTKDLKVGRLWLEDKAAEKRWSELPHHMRDSTVNVLSTLIAHHHGSVSKEDGDRRVVLFMEGMPREWIDPQEWLLSQV